MLARDCLAEFKVECDLRRLSSRTTKGYYNNTALFLMYLENQLEVTKLEDIRTPHIKKYLQYLIENTLTGNLILTVMLAFAEYERGMIVEHTQMGKAVARQDPNYHEGRPRKYTACQLHHAIELLNSGKTYRQVEAMTGISKSRLIRAKRA